MPSCVDLSLDHLPLPHSGFLSTSQVNCPYLNAFLGLCSQGNSNAGAQSLINYFIQEIHFLLDLPHKSTACSFSSPALNFDVVFMPSLSVMTVWMISCSLLSVKIICTPEITHLHFQLRLPPEPQTFYPIANLKLFGNLVGISNLTCPKTNSIPFPNLPFPTIPSISIQGNSTIPVSGSKAVVIFETYFFLETSFFF